MVRIALRHSTQLYIDSWRKLDIKTIIFDLDNTLANLDHRLHFIKPSADAEVLSFKPNWDAFFAAVGEDTVIEHVAAIFRILYKNPDTTIIIASGRSDICYAATKYWLWQHNLGHGNNLYMRKHGDHRPDYKVKLDILHKIRKDGFDPIMAFDDRQQVVDMWRANNVPCAQVSEGNF